MQRDYARHVEAPKVQVHILAGHSVRFHANDSFRRRRLLGVWWWAARPFQRLRFTPQDRLPWRRRYPYAHPPGKLSVHFCISLLVKKKSQKVTSERRYFLNFGNVKKKKKKPTKLKINKWPLMLTFELGLYLYLYVKKKKITRNLCIKIYITL